MLGQSSVVVGIGRVRAGRGAAVHGAREYPGVTRRSHGFLPRRKKTGEQAKDVRGDLNRNEKKIRYTTVAVQWIVYPTSSALCKVVSHPRTCTTVV